MKGKFVFDDQAACGGGFTEIAEGLADNHFLLMPSLANRASWLQYAVATLCMGINSRLNMAGFYTSGDGTAIPGFPGFAIADIAGATNCGQIKTGSLTPGSLATDF